MTTSSLDTLDIARRLKSVGFNDAQAEEVTEIIRDVRTADLANLATRADIERLEAKLEIFRRDMTIRLGSMIVVATGILLAAKFFG
jgi:hypothetical protein